MGSGEGKEMHRSYSIFHLRWWPLLSISIVDLSVFLCEKIWIHPRDLALADETNKCCVKKKNLLAFVPYQRDKNYPRARQQQESIPVLVCCLKVFLISARLVSLLIAHHKRTWVKANSQFPSEGLQGSCRKAFVQVNLYKIAFQAVGVNFPTTVVCEGSVSGSSETSKF